MNAPLYTTDILRLAASVPFAERLPDAMGTAERRSPICGSRVTVDINVDDAGRVAAIGMIVRACALGQASASLMAASALGKSAGEIARARDALAGWLTGDGAPPEDWPGLDLFAPARPHRARHASILLSFDAAADATAQAAAR